MLLLIRDELILEGYRGGKIGLLGCDKKDYIFFSLVYI